MVSKPSALRCAAGLVSASMLLVASGLATAAGGGAELETPLIDQANVKSLQSGARHFINNCMGCHSVEYSRYNRVAEDLELSEEDVANNFIFTTDADGEPTKVGSLMNNNMSREYGEQAFGVKPPDLSLTARSRGSDWIYTFLKSFYVEPGRVGTGANNTVFAGTAMPHVLWNYQGWQELDDEGNLTLVEEGSMSPAEYDDMIADITNFLGYVADPIKVQRHRIGKIVLLFLFGLLAVAWFLKKEYWKDVV